MNLDETTLLLTRPEPAARRFLGEVESALGRFRSVVVSPLMEIVPLDVSVDRRPDLGFAFTSENGIRALADRIAAAGRKAWCVGERTAAAARAAGFDVDTAAGDVESLAQVVIAAAPQGPVLHVSGRHRRGDLAGRLRAAGLDAHTLVAYDQIARPLSAEALLALAGDGDLVAPVFSPRTAKLLATAAGHRRAPLHLVAISDAAGRDWSPRAGETVTIARSPDAAAMIAAMGRLFDADPSLEAGPLPS